MLTVSTTASLFPNLSIPELAGSCTASHFLENGVIVKISLGWPRKKDPILKKQLKRNLILVPLMKSVWACSDTFPVYTVNITLATITGRSDDMLISVPRAIRVWVRDYMRKQRDIASGSISAVPQSSWSRATPTGDSDWSGAGGSSERTLRRIKKTKHNRKQVSSLPLKRNENPLTFTIIIHASTLALGTPVKPRAVIFSFSHIISTLSLPPHSEINTRVSSRNILSEALKEGASQPRSVWFGSTMALLPHQAWCSQDPSPPYLPGRAAGHGPWRKAACSCHAAPPPHEYQEHTLGLILNTKHIPPNWNLVH